MTRDDDPRDPGAKDETTAVTDPPTDDVTTPDATAALTAATVDQPATTAATPGADDDDDDQAAFRPVVDSHHGAIAWMGRNAVASNLLMMFILVGGLVGILRTKQEVFPEFTIDIVRVTVPYPGAGPEEVEQGIILVTEEAVRGVDGVKMVSSVAQENSGTVAAELLLGADPDKVLNDIKGVVDRITSYPLLAERPTVKLVSRRREVISLILAGDQDLKTLHALGERARNEILEDERVTQVDLMEIPPVEIAVELRREDLEKYALTSQMVARQLMMASLELPGGEIETRGGELLVRVADRAMTGAQFGEVVLKSTPTGGIVHLRDVATIHDGYADNDTSVSYNGKNAIRLTAYRIGDETPTSVATAVKAFAERFQTELGDTVEVATWADSSEVLEARINLLVNNAWIGLLLVLLVLALFLDLRLAFWVGLGIPISFMGAFLLMPVFDLSVNMVSLFAFIITLGLVVDDAIIVGEHAFHKIEAGLSPMKAAITGAREMAMPVTFAVLTTTIAFSPLLFVPGVMGKIFKLIPLVVISVLIFSVVEGFFILPAHIGHTKAGKPLPRLFLPLERANHLASTFLRLIIFSVYEPFLRFTVRWRYATVATAAATLIFTIGILAAGIVPFSFFPKLEGDQVRANVRLPYGAAESLSIEVNNTIETAAFEAIEAFGGRKYVRGLYARVGSGPTQGGPGGGASETGSHLVSFEVNLVPQDERPFTAFEFAAKWRELTPDIAGVQSMVFDAATGPGAGKAVDVQLAHRQTEILAAASGELAAALREFSELMNVENGWAAGKPQLDFQLKPSAASLGLTANDLALQIRSSFFGAEALREQRGRDEMRVMVRLADDQRASEFDLEQLRIRTPQGGSVPLSYVATFERTTSPTAINREEGKRIINVSGELSPGVPSARPILEELERSVLPDLRDKYPGLDVSFVGAQRSQKEAMASLLKNFLLAIVLIFGLLAIPFRSYAQPAIVMSAIPFGLVGAVAGHWVMGFEMSIISVMGVVALAGVVVNDSLVLIDAANRERVAGSNAYLAIVYAGTRRFRPILLTSLTTFFGLMPMIFETDMQARFLIPMAISLGFGVLFATAIALIVVPTLYMILEDAKRLIFLDYPATGEPTT